MNRTTRATLALAALGLALSGCTGSSEEEPKAQATPQDKWAKTLCEGLAPTTAPVEPPATAGADVAASKKEIVTFLQTLHDRLDTQGQVLKDVGAPPEVDPAAYAKARTSLASGASTLEDVIKRFKKADPADAEQMQSSLVQVSESLAGSASYQGPLADLSASDANLKKAFESNEECVAIMS